MLPTPLTLGDHARASSYVFVRSKQRDTPEALILAGVRAELVRGKKREPFAGYI